VVFADRAYGAALLAARRYAQEGGGGGGDGGGPAGPLPMRTLVWVDVEPPPASPTGVSASGAAAAALAAGDQQEFEYEALLGGSSGAHLSGLCAEVLAEGSVDDGYHMYYTSGTTGRPKGVVLSHRIVVHHGVATVKGEMRNARRGCHSL
jgi:hypothetical protein